MTNAERRRALDKARRKALEYAEAADRVTLQGDGSKDWYVTMANTWAHVAGAMKDGSPDHDSVLDTALETEYGTITR